MVGSPLPDVLTVLVFRGGAEAAAAIEAVAPERLRVVDVEGQEPEAALLRETHVAYLGFPVPEGLTKAMPGLRWAHFSFAGVSNLLDTDWWGLEGPVVTSARGATGALSIAETVIAAVFLFAKQLHVAVRETAAHEYVRTGGFDGMLLVAGKTIGIVGLGGIGHDVARLARGVGMRVVATRRSAQQRQRNVDGVDELFPPSEQNEMLAQADFVSVCAMWTSETEGMIDAAAFAAMKPGAVLINVARGEILDEAALVEAVLSGRLGGAFLDVWHGQLEGVPPAPALQDAENVVFAPHVSARSDVPQFFSLDLFTKNLQRFLAGEPLENAIDWSRGY